MARKTTKAYTSKSKKISAIKPAQATYQTDNAKSLDRNKKAK